MVYKRYCNVAVNDDKLDYERAKLKKLKKELVNAYAKVVRT